MADLNDILGLDKPIRLGGVSRIPKLTDELLFDSNRGLPQVRNNYTGLLRSIKKNDKAVAGKITKAPSKAAARQLKVAAEVENLQKVLLFYQLWCHGLFPRATFSDCLKMIRNHKSFVVKEYRRELINNELHRLRVDAGIIIENEETQEPEDDLYAPEATDGADQASTNRDTNDSDDDWGFLSTRRARNGLFVADDDEEIDAEDLARPETTQARRPIDDTEIPDEFDEADFDRPQQEEEDEGPSYDEELAIMREMGM